MNEEKVEVLKSANQYMNNLKKGINNVNELIENGKYSEVCNTIYLIGDGIEWLTQAIFLTKDIHKKKINIGDINEHLQNIVEALENEDYILIGDLFKYEILPILDRVHCEIKENLK